MMEQLLNLVKQKLAKVSDPSERFYLLALQAIIEGYLVEAEQTSENELKKAA